MLTTKISKYFCLCKQLALLFKIIIQKVLYYNVKGVIVIYYYYILLMKSYFLNILTGLLLFFTPIHGLIVTVGLIVLLDTFTGIFKSVKLKGWCSIRSRTLSNIISKMLLYEMCIIILFPIDKFLLNELIIHLVSVQYFATKLTCIIIILIEGTSIKENIEEALKIKIWDILKKILSRAKEVKNDIDDLNS